jgi:hypothetical protein
MKSLHVIARRLRSEGRIRRHGSRGLYLQSACAESRGGHGHHAVRARAFLRRVASCRTESHVRHKWSAERVARDFFFVVNQHFQDLGLELPAVCEAAQKNHEEVLPLWGEWKGRAAQPMRLN